MSFNLVWIGVRMSFILVGWICQFGRAFDSANLFGRQPAVAWQGPFFSRNSMSLIFWICFVISSISGHEKDAQRDLEKNRPIFVP